MPLPPKPFHAVQEIASRWQVEPSVIVGWAIEQRLALKTALPMVGTVEGKNASGLLEVAGEDVFWLFGADAIPIASVRRFRRDPEAKWELMITPPDGVAVRASGVLIERAEVERFERLHRLFHSNDAVPNRPQEPSSRGGAPSRYDWEGFAGAVARRVHDKGMPESQGELIRDMLDWFDATHGACPDESTVRRRVQAAWRELTRPA
jgi:hypothetical protein